MIHAKNLHYSIGTKPILKGINLHFDQGELVGIIGANGSGKTTLLKCLCGLYETQDTIAVDGHSIETLDHKERAKKIAFMKQSINLSFDLPCYEVIAMGRYAYSKGMAPLSEEDKTIIQQTMKQTNTEQFAHRSIRHLSGGERQRVMLAKALVQKSPHLVLDEPSSALDIKYEQEIFKFAQNLQREERCIIMSIHNIRMAIEYCKRLVLLKDGCVLVDGSVSQVITEENLQNAYGIKSKVYENPVTGMLDFQLK